MALSIDTLARAAHRGGIAWSVFLPLSIAAWWALVLLVPGAAWWFSPESLGWSALWAFAVPDTVLVAIPSLYAARLLVTDRARTPGWLWLIAGAQGYASLWSLVATLVTGEALAGPILMLPVFGVCLTVAWTARPADAWFIEADAERSTAVNVFHTMLHTVLFDGIFLVVAPILILWTETALGIPNRHLWGLFWPMLPVVVFLNLFVGLGSGIVMAVRGRGTPLPVDTAAALVTTGPYAHLRNPMASVGILQGVLLGIGLGSLGVVAYSICGAVLWHLFVRPIEEEDLERRFGEDYRRYKASVPLWIPRLRPWQ